MSHKYNIGDILLDNRVNDYLLIISIEPDELFGIQSYLLARIYGSNKKTVQYYCDILGMDGSNEITLVA